MDKGFGWLGRFPLSVDVADTVRIVGGVDVDLLASDDDLARWIDAELPRFPFAASARGHLARFRALRDSVRDLLYAHAESRPLPSPAVAAVNRAAAASPNYPSLTRAGAVQVKETARASFAVFGARVARSAMDVIATDERALAICHAPSCGMLFVRKSAAQRWCSVRCGTRDRVARHAARRTTRLALPRGRSPQGKR